MCEKETAEHIERLETVVTIQEEELAALVAALKWYGERIAMVAGFGDKSEEYLKAVTFELAVDGGKRAGAALGALENPNHKEEE